MKGKDLFMIGGLGLAVYLLVPKAKEAAAAGGVTILPAAPAGPDIGGIFSGMASIFGAMPEPIVPEINIPEFKFPDPGAYIPEEPDGEGLVPDWEKYIPNWEGLLPDWDKLLHGLGLANGNGEKDGNGGETIIDKVIDAVTPDVLDIIDPFNIFKFPDVTPGVSQWNIWKGDTAETLSDIAEYARKTTTITNLFVPTHYYEQAAQKWEEEGYPKQITPEWAYAKKEAEMGILPQDLARILEANQGISPEAPTMSEEDLRYPEYEADIELLKKHPYFSTVL